jgi:hypothetical protein
MLKFVRSAFKDVEEYMVVKNKLEGRVIGKLVWESICTYLCIENMNI